MRTFVSTMAVLAISSTAPAFQLKRGDVYDWSSWNLISYTETPLRLTVLDSFSPAGGLADSGSIWRILLQSGSSNTDTLALFAFNDGDLRWWSGSDLFPVEFQSPSSVSVWSRANRSWGAYACQGCLLITDYKHTEDGAEMVGQRYVGSTVPGSSPLQNSIERIHGIWTDSAGPIWFHAEAHFDLFLTSKNGQTIVWQSPHLDTLRRRADSLNGSVLQLRSKIRHPQIGDRFLWKEEVNRSRTPPAPTDPSFRTVTVTTAIVADAPADSSGWIRRSFKMVADSSVQISGGTLTRDTSYSTRSDTALVQQRWDSSGNVRYDVQSILSDSWTVRAGDVRTPEGNIKRGTKTFLPTGELLRQHWYSAQDFTGVCRTCSDSRSVSVDLLSAPGYVANSVASPQSRFTKPGLLAIQAIAHEDPLATVNWSTLDGRAGSQSISEFAREHRSGIYLVRVRTSRGDIIAGRVVEM